VASVSYTKVLSSKLLFELRGGYNRFHEDFFPEDHSFDPGTIGSNPTLERDEMRIGVPTEIKTDEYRVALTPAGVRELVDNGHEVLIQAGAGKGSAIPDSEYVDQGAELEIAESWEFAVTPAKAGAAALLGFALTTGWPRPPPG